jgi:uncharacterized protein
VLWNRGKRAYSNNFDDKQKLVLLLEFLEGQVNRMNRFSSSTIEHLKNYVYQLRNPITGEVFYVGKGSGNRVFEHVRKINEINANDSPKVKLIQKIHLSGKKVIEEIIAYDLTEREALLIESSVIKSHSLDKLTNKVHGY